MKIWIVTAVGLVIGTLGGSIVTWYDLSSSGDLLDLFPAATAVDTDATGQSLPDAEALPGVMVAGGEEFDFGVMERDTTSSHEFVFRNVGGSPLQLVKGETTCKCAVSSLGSDMIPPGQTATVTLEWTPNAFSPEFRQRAEIMTNDPLRPLIELVVFGRVSQPMRTLPGDVMYGRISANRAKTARVMLFGYRDVDLQVVEQAFTQQNTAEYFETKITPMDAEDVSRDVGAGVGWNIFVTVNPGLSLGPIEQTLELTPNYEDLRTLTIPVRGTIVSDISFVGRGYDSERNVLKLGKIAAADGVSTNMYLLVKGPLRQEVEVSIKSVDPADVLQVRLGERKEINEGAVIQYPITVEIPPGSRSTSRLGSESSRIGEILFETTHPQAQHVPLRVYFAVQD